MSSVVHFMKGVEFVCVYSVFQIIMMAYVFFVEKCVAFIFSIPGLHLFFDATTRCQKC